jgi:tRNA (guanine-N7-)-methyltransferase
MTETRRAIRSYVLRSGRMTPGQRRALDALWPVYGLNNQDSFYDLQAVFGRDAPITIEIGFGNGENLVHLAAANPQNNYLGIEVHEPGVGHCLIEADLLKLANLKVIRRDAIEVLRLNIPDASLARLNLFFPDPWHKKRHHKRRIVQPAFANLVADKLVTGGILHIATDWENYAEQIENVMRATERFDSLDAAPQDRIETRFDKRGARLGHRNWERAWCKRSNVNAAEKSGV